MDEYKIGEVFQFGKKKLKCVKGTCAKCVFDKMPCSVVSKYTGECMGDVRKDGSSVCFIEVKEEDNG